MRAPLTARNAARRALPRLLAALLAAALLAFPAAAAPVAAAPPGTLRAIAAVGTGRFALVTLDPATARPSHPLALPTAALNRGLTFFSAYDPAGGQLFFNAEDRAGARRLVTLDTRTGVVVADPVVAPPSGFLSALEVDPAAGLVHSTGFLDAGDGSRAAFFTVDPATGQILRSVVLAGLLPGLGGINYYVSASDPATHRYFAPVTDVDGQGRLGTIDTRTGALTMGAVWPADFQPLSLDFDPATGALYSFGRGNTPPWGSGYVFVRIDPASGAPTRLGAWPYSSAFQVSGVAALDAAAGRYYLVAFDGDGPDGSQGDLLVTLDTTTGMIVASAPFPPSLRADRLLVDPAGAAPIPTPIVRTLAPTGARPLARAVGGVPRDARTVTICNGTPGLGGVQVVVNGRTLPLVTLGDGGQVVMDVGRYLKPDAAGNIIAVRTGWNQGGRRATVTIAEGATSCSPA